MTTQQLITRDFHGATIRQRFDGYLNATDMCQANGKRFGDYKRLKNTKEFFNALSRLVGIPTDLIIQITRKGLNNKRGIWIEPHAAINLAQWCSPEFAALVSDWVFELLTKGSVSLDPAKSKPAQLIQAKSNELTKLGITGNTKRIALNNFIKEQFGYDTLAMFEMESQPAEIQQTLIIPSDIAKRIGLQTKHHDSKNNIYYVLTEKGLKYGQYQDFSIGKTTRRKIKWYESVVELFQPTLTLVPKQTPQSTLELF